MPSETPETASIPIPQGVWTPYKIRFTCGIGPGGTSRGPGNWGVTCGRRPKVTPNMLWVRKTEVEIRGGVLRRPCGRGLLVGPPGLEPGTVRL